MTLCAAMAGSFLESLWLIVAAKGKNASLLQLAFERVTGDVSSMYMSSGSFHAFRDRLCLQSIVLVSTRLP
jgi:hypothetical protein